ncbi:class I SAM-dependent methyltransferase [Streptomyces sp. NBC_01275]|uniref:class I SAM-dependent DNA methyltransferase n=1 Tax=Streptomyces sp. NBC_01275 TaxID=2903807 RepID=UPI00225BB21E|nr:class I SAM-dependent methyltransferase [Streptomyces sp. NBC_01275]MCX4766687.1 class I SAM-dependent methyltransferase [Streptomyces sp. NBC_01275]
MYGPGMAELYDLLHEARGKDYRAEAATVAGLVRARSPRAATLLDVACGTGAHLRHFAELFDKVEGLELSEAMMARARAAAPGAVLHGGDMRDLALGRSYDAITCMFGSIAYLEDTAELASTLRSFAEHLAPGGVVAVDPWWFLETSLEHHVSGDTVTVGRRTMTRVSYSEREGRTSHMVVHYVVAEPGSGVQHFAERHTLTLFTRAEYEEAFTRAGLDVVYVGGIQSGRGLFLADRGGRAARG